MTEFDDLSLRDVIHQAAQNFEPSLGARQRIFDDAASHFYDLDRSSTLHSYRETARRHRRSVVSVAAAVVMVVIAVPLLQSESPRTGSFLSARFANQHQLSGVALSDGSFFASGNRPFATSAPVKGLTIHGLRIAITQSHVSDTGAVDLVVPDGTLNDNALKLTNWTIRDGGYVASSQLTLPKSKHDHAYGTLVLDVPQNKFAGLARQIQATGFARSLTLYASDLSSQFVDLSARIHAAQLSLRQYSVIILRATTVSDVLAVQSRINDIQTTIQQLQGQLNLVNSQTTYGALTVSLSEKGAPHVVKHHESGPQKALHASINGFLDGFNWLIRLIGPLLFGGLVVAGALGLTRFIRRRRASL